MQRHVPDVDSYIAACPAERQTALLKFRDLCRTILTGFQEEIDYGMPVYKRAGIGEIAFASQKQYISFYVLKKEVVDEHRRALGSSSIGKSCIRFKKPEQIDFAAVAILLRRTVESGAQRCQRFDSAG